LVSICVDAGSGDGVGAGSPVYGRQGVPRAAEQVGEPGRGVWMETHRPVARVVTPPRRDQVRAISGRRSQRGEHRRRPRAGVSGAHERNEWKSTTSWWRRWNPRLQPARVPRHPRPHAPGHSHEACGIIPHFWTAARALTHGEDAGFWRSQPDDPDSEFASVRVGQVERDHDQLRSTPRTSREPVPPNWPAVLVGPTYVEDMRTEYGVDSRSTRRKCWVSSRSIPMTAWSPTRN